MADSGNETSFIEIPIPKLLIERIMKDTEETLKGIADVVSTDHQIPY